MGKKCVLVSDCETGDIIAQKIVSSYGATIAVENTTINGYIKNKLQMFKIDYIWIYETGTYDEVNYNDKNLLEINQNYRNNIEQLTVLINDLSRGEGIDNKEVDTIYQSVYSSIDKEYYIVKYLNKIKINDEDLYKHSLNSAIYGMLIGKWLCLSKNEIKQIVQAGLLHDIGKLKVPSKILNKRGKLTEKEFEEIKKHTIYGYEMVNEYKDIIPEVKEAILMHHERMDKSGYPLGKGGGDINLYSQIISIADVYDAITSERVYKKRKTPFEAFRILKNDSIGCFNIHIIETFLQNIAVCYIGAKVKLSNGSIGEIVYVPPHEIIYPIVSVGKEYIDLFKEKDIIIEKML